MRVFLYILLAIILLLSAATLAVSAERTATPFDEDDLRNAVDCRASFVKRNGRSETAYFIAGD